MKIESKINLDEIERYKEIDKKNLLKISEEFPEQMEEALNICKNVSLKPFVPSNILIFGMGGSGIGGELLQVLMNEKLNIPINCFHHYDIPEYGGEKSLAIMVSYSGNTEETLKACEKIKERNARIVAITSGGRLLEKTEECRGECIRIPGGYQPRSAPGFLFLPVLYTLYKTGLIENPEEEIKNTIESLKKEREHLKRYIPLSQNKGKELAEKILGTTPLIYASRYYLEPVAKRWKTQLNENAKILAYSDIFPELCHNTICGWDRSSEKGKYTVIMLRTKDEDNSTKTRVEYLKEIINEKGNHVEEIIATGNSKLEKIFTTLYLADFVSIYLGLLRGVDPSAIERINTLKDKLTVSGS